MKAGTLVLIVMVLAALAGCGGGSAADGGAGGMGGSSDGGRTGGPIPCGALCDSDLPEDAITLGDTGADCDVVSVWYAGPQEVGDLASQPIALPCAGTVTGVHVVHQLTSATGPCATTDREVWISTAGEAQAVPVAHETLPISATLASKGKPSDLVPNAVVLGGELPLPLHGEAGETVHVASAVTGGVCVVGCDNAAVEGSWCTEPTIWDGCGLMSGPYPGVGKPVGWIAWLDFLPDDPAACE